MDELQQQQAFLARVFRRNGYARRQNQERYAEEGYRKYKKGFEVRLVARNLAELEEMRAALTAAGFTPGKAFLKATQWVQPVYGKAAQGEFLALVERSQASEEGDASPGAMA